MRYKITIIAVLTFLVFCSFFENYQRDSIEYSLAITLMPHYPDGLITFGLAKTKDDSLIEHQILSERNWVLIGSGEMMSKANPEYLNLFQKHDIQNCSTIYLPAFRKTNVYCPLLERVWKVRYDTLPGSQGNSGVKDFDSEKLGWASDRQHPSLSQLEILAKYGISTVSDAIYGDSLWLFLQDINDETWIKNYQAH